jgi:hypothetical protein
MFNEIPVKLELVVPVTEVSPTVPVTVVLLILAVMVLAPTVPSAEVPPSTPLTAVPPMLAVIEVVPIVPPAVVLPIEPDTAVLSMLAVIEVVPTVPPAVVLPTEPDTACEVNADVKLTDPPDPAVPDTTLSAALSKVVSLTHPVGALV